MEELNLHPQSEPTFDENVAAVLHSLPPAVQDFLTGPERDAVTIELTNKYQLHADQAGQFQRSLIFMLMGIYTPERFMDTLSEAGVSEETINSLVADVNERVFKRLQEAERTASAPAPVPAAPRMAPPPAPSQPLVPAMELVPPVPPTPPVAPAPAAPQPVPAPAPVVPPAPRMVPPPANLPTDSGPSMRTMASDMQAVREHREAAPMPLHPAAHAPEPIPSPTPAPQVIVPPPAPPAASVSAPAPRIEPAPPANLPGTPIVKEYSVDPYREPIE